MSCEDIPSLLDLQKVKKHAEDFGRLMGTGTGTSTNEVTGQVRPTYNAVMANLGYTRVGTFASGGTLTTGRQTLLWDIADGGDGQEYGWSGSFPLTGKIVPPGSTPHTTGGIAVGAWISRFDPDLRIQVREALRRSYADAGYNLVDGSFEAGGTLVNANDALLHEASGKAFSGPAGPVSAGTNPASGGFVDRSGDISVYAGSYDRVRSYSGTSSLIYCGGRTSVFDGAGGHFVLDATDTNSADNDCTTLVGVGGKRWKRVYSGAVNAEWAGVIPSSSYVHTELLNLIANFNSAVFRAGNYKLNATILVQNKSFRFIGQGPRATFFDFYTAGDHLSFKSVNGGFNDFSGIVDCCVRNLSAAAANAITVSGRNGNPQPVTSFSAENIAINTYNQVGSKGLVLNGIEASTFNRLYIQADSPISSLAGSNGGIDRSTISNFYLVSTGVNKGITITSSASDVVIENGISALGTGLLYYSPAAHSPVHLALRDLRCEQPTTKTAWAFDIVGGSTLVTFERVTAGNCNGIRAANCRSITILDSYLGFNYSGSDALLAYSFNNVGYARVENVLGDLHTTISVTEMTPTRSLTRQENPRVVYSGEWTRDLTFGTWSYDTSNGLKKLCYKVDVPTGPLATRLPISAPIVNAAQITVSFKSKTTVSVEMVSAIISEGGIASTGASANSGAFSTSTAGKIGLLYQAGAGIYIMNNTGLQYDAIVTILLM